MKSTYNLPPAFAKLGLSRDSTESKDCAVVAVALLAGVSYEDAHAACELAGRERNDGMYTHNLIDAFAILDVELEEVPTQMRMKKVYSSYYHESYQVKQVIMQPNGNAYTVKTIGKGYADGRYLGIVNNHFFSLIDGEVEDWSHSSKRVVLRLYKVVGSENPF